MPGDLIMMGAPGGVGAGRSPQLWMRPGQELVTWVEGVGELRNRVAAATRAPHDRDVETGARSHRVHA